MSIAPYLLLPGTARAALEDYARIFGADDLRVLTVGDAPPAPGLPADPDHVIHAEITVGGSPLMAADGAAEASGVLYYAAPDAEGARRAFDALAEGGAVQRPLAPTFWSPAFGIVTDRWGVTWRITVARPAGA